MKFLNSLCPVIILGCISANYSLVGQVTISMPLKAWEQPVTGWQWAADQQAWSYIGQSNAGAGWTVPVTQGQWTWSGLIADNGSWQEGYWVMVLPTVTQTIDPLSIGLVAHYPMDGDAVEVLGNGADGVVANAVPGSNRHGQAGKALTFDEQSNVIIPYTAEAAIGTADFSVTLWFRLNPEVDTQASALLTTESNTGGRNGLFFWFITGDAAPVKHTLGIEVWRGNKNAFVINNYPLNDGAWHHLAVIRKGREVWMYLNADLAGVNEVRTLEQPIPLTNPLILGNGSSSIFQNTFNGQMDDLRLYNRALNSTEVAQLVAEVAN